RAPRAHTTGDLQWQITHVPQGWHSASKLFLPRLYRKRSRMTALTTLPSQRHVSPTTCSKPPSTTPFSVTQIRYRVLTKPWKKTVPCYVEKWEDASIFG